jgi:two-component system, response regulator YesN
MAESQILIADDEPDFRQLLGDMFMSKPWKLHFAAQGVEALQMLCDLPLDLAILDIYMPGLNGLEVLQRMNQRGVHIPVILVTGFGTREGTLQTAVQAVKEGAVDVVEKPFRQSHLIQTIESRLRQRDSSTNQLVSQLDAHLKDHAFDPQMSLSVLGAQFRITPRYVTELFRKHLKTTFRTRLNAYRIQKAKLLIESTDLPLYDIAEQCGFKNYRRLTAVFNREFNMPPRRYREMGF